MACTISTLMDVAFTSSLDIAEFLEEQQLERHTSDFPVGVHRLAHDEPACTGDIQGHDREEVYVNVLAPHDGT